MKRLACFKAYDIRGRLPDELNEDMAYCIGRAYAEVLGAKKVVTGYDIRLSSPAIEAALSQGLCDSGCEVYHIGLCGTEEVYFATFHYGFEGGLMVTASHNPVDYNGIKLVHKQAQPVMAETGLDAIHQVTLERRGMHSHAGVWERERNVSLLEHRPDYIQHLLTYIDVKALKPLKIAVDPGSGGAGLVLDALEPHLPFDLVKVNYEPDGHFPNGIPNPLLVEQRHSIIQAVKAHQADLGLAWDGDFDRCFFIDETGRFIEGYYLVGLLAQAFLAKASGAKIIHDPRLIWNTQDVVNAAGGIPVQSRTGHAFIKARMREEDAVYGGEMSAHHYFRSFAYCDSGMIPWLLVTELMSQTGQSLSSLVNERMQKYPCSGEINFRVSDTQEAVDTVEQYFAENTDYRIQNIDRSDGLSLAFADWRFNLRASNTEPLLRLNVESIGDDQRVDEGVATIERIIAGM